MHNTNITNSNSFPDEVKINLNVLGALMLDRIGGTTTEQAFGPSHLSRLPLDPGPKSALVPGPTASRGKGGRGLLSRLEPPTGTKGCADLLSRLEPPIGTNG